MKAHNKSNKIRLFVLALGICSCSTVFAFRGGAVGGDYHDGGWHGGGWYGGNGGYYVGQPAWNFNSCQNVQVCDANNSCWIEQNCN